jgi:hypothetical protein
MVVPMIVAKTIPRWEAGLLAAIEELIVVPNVIVAPPSRGDWEAVPPILRRLYLHVNHGNMKM